ncbi:MAG: hypothetical protein ABIH63_04245 [archaeon]
MLVDNAFSKHKTSVKCVEDKLEDLAGFVRKVRRQTLNNGGVGLPELKNLEEKVHSIKKSVQFLKDTDIFRVAITTKLTSDEILKEAKDHNVLIVSLLKIGFVNRKVQFVADGSFQNLKDFLARMKDVERAEELNHIDASR